MHLTPIHKIILNYIQMLTEFIGLIQIMLPKHEFYIKSNNKITVEKSINALVIHCTLQLPSNLTRNQKCFTRNQISLLFSGIISIETFMRLKKFHTFVFEIFEFSYSIQMEMV